MVFQLLMVMVVIVKNPMSLLHTVVSAYEVQDIVQLMHESDEKAIINVIPTENFFGGFYQRPIE